MALGLIPQEKKKGLGLIPEKDKPSKLGMVAPIAAKETLKQLFTAGPELQKEIEESAYTTKTPIRTALKATALEFTPKTPQEAIGFGVTGGVLPGIAKGAARLAGKAFPILETPLSRFVPKALRPKFPAEVPQPRIATQQIKPATTPEQIPEVLPGQKVKAPAIPVPPPKTQLKELKRARFDDIQEGLLESNKFVNSIDRATTELEREAIPFLREKTGVPKELGRPDLDAIVKNPPKRLLKVAEDVGKYLDEAHEFIVENIGDDMGFVENYISHIWDIPKNKRIGVMNWFATVKNNPFLKKRSIATIKEGVEKFGLRPKTLDVSNILSYYDQWKVKSVANTRFAKELAGLVDDSGQKLIQRVDKAPDLWPVYDHPALNRAIGIPSGEDKLLIQKLPVRVHPEIESELKVLFDRPYTGPIAKAVNTLAAFVKKTQLSLSLFHHAALTEAGVPWLGAKNTLKVWNPAKVYKALARKEFDIFKNMEVAKDAVRHRVQLGAIGDVMRGSFKNMLLTAEARLKKTPMLGKAVKTVRKANDLWDAALWDYFHNALKLKTYESHVARELKKLPRNATQKQIDELKDAMGQLTNDTFGGQPWELFSIHPKTLQWLHGIFLSPDWGFSTIRQGLAPLGIGATSKGTRAFRAKKGVEFWIKAALYYTAFADSINLYNSKKHTGEYKHMWENDPGRKTHVFMGFDEKGRKVYEKMGKQYRELPELLIDPVKKIGGKLSPLVQQFLIQSTGYSGSGFPSEIAKERERGKEGLGLVPARIKELASMPAPFSLRGVAKSGRPSSIIFPVRKGLSEYEGQKFFVKALEEGDKERIDEVYKSLLENNLDARRVFNQAENMVKSKKNKEYWEQAKEYFDELNDGEKSMIEMQEVVNGDGSVSREVKTKVFKLISNQRRIEAQRQNLRLPPLRRRIQ